MNLLQLFVNRTLLVALLLLVLSAAPYTFTAYAQDSDAIVNSLLEPLAKINDLSADIDIKIDIDYLNIPTAHAAYFYKAPDKSRIKTNGFGLLPKQGIGLPAAMLLKGKFTSLGAGKEKINGKTLSKIKIIPNEDQSEIILSVIWVNEQTHLMEKAVVTTKRGQVEMTFQYSGKAKQYGLPQKVELGFVVPAMMLPKSLTGDVTGKKSNNDASKEVKGKAIVYYKNYRINKGLSDDVFTEN